MVLNDTLGDGRRMGPPKREREKSVRMKGSADSYTTNVGRREADAPETVGKV